MTNCHHSRRSRDGALVFAQTATSSPKTDVILTVSGDIQSNTAGFDLDALKALGARTITTSTIWTTGTQTIAGVSLDTLMSAPGAARKDVEATALNVNTIDIPTSGITADGPIIAYERNGAPMSVRDKGPLWIIYTHRTWQLDHITVLQWP